MDTPRHSVIVATLLAGWAVAPLCGQIPGVDLFQDSESDSVCDVVNSANAQLVVLQDTGEFVLVTGEDTRIDGSVVDVNGDVFIGGEPFGFVTFADDGDGLRSLWWLAPSGFAVHIDTLTLQISESFVRPAELIDVPCDACRFWDVTADCTRADPPDGGPPGVRITFCGSGLGLIGLPILLGLSGLGRCRRKLGS